MLGRGLLVFGAIQPTPPYCLATAFVYAGTGRVLLPLSGIVVGNALPAGSAPWRSAAVIVLVLVGLATARESLEEGAHGTAPPAQIDLTSPEGLVLSGGAISLGVLALGFSLPLLRLRLTFSLVLIRLF